MKKTILRLAALGIAAAAAPQAFAEGTLASTTVNNTATVNFAVGGVNQAPVTSNTATFIVDRKVNLTVVEVGNADTVVSPGSTDQVLAFTVTNLSNSVMDFGLAATNDANALAHGGTDNFDATNVRVFLDVNNNGVYDPATDTATFIDELAPDTSRTVFIVANIPAGQANNSLAGYALTAIARDAGAAGTQGAVSANTAGADGAGTLETVLADAAGDGSSTDVARDGRASDDDAYRVSTAQVTVAKSSRVISDPFNGTSNPKRIPGAIVEYCIEVANAAGGAAASNVAVSDPINTQPVTFNPGSIRLGGTSCAANDGTAVTDATDTDAGEFVSTTETVAARFASVAAATTSRVQFRVTID